jgi:signal peptidase II
MKKTYLKIAPLAILFFALDQLLKWTAHQYFQKPIAITSWFSLRYEQNTGIAWSIPVPFALLIAANVIFLLLLPFLIANHLDLRQKKAQFFLSFLFGGALGNLFDRLTRGYVIDYISVGTWPVFNLADALLCIGIFFILLFYGKIKRV